MYFENMKDIGNKLFRIVLGVWLLVYLGFIIINESVVVGWDVEFMNFNNLFVIWITTVFALLVFLDSIRPICFKKPRLGYFLVGLFVLFFGAYSIQDVPESYLFLSDMLRIIGVLIIILGLIGIITPESCKERQEKEKVEIIEA